MEPSPFLTDVLMAFAAQPVLMALVIVAATFVLEDVATVTIALIAANGAIDVPLALAALVLGTALGDLGVYGAGRWAGRWLVVRRAIERPLAAPLIAWMRRRGLVMVAIARFTPGLRLPVFAAAGSLGVPAGGFAAVIGATTLVWTPGLFFLAKEAGMAAPLEAGVGGWAVAIALLALLMLAPRFAAPTVAARA